jgi:ADP-heptose:LPS heptosyltransferase
VKQKDFYFLPCTALTYPSRSEHGRPHGKWLERSVIGGETIWPARADSFSAALPRRRQILVLQLGHFGDFIISLPALRQLRGLFPNDLIRLVVGSWNRQQAAAACLADDVVTHDFFPENAKGWDGRPHQDAAAFATAAAGTYDLAIDLRVDPDTRFLLQHAKAALRAGIGLPGSFPFLDIALPLDHEGRCRDKASPWTNRLFGPEQFHSNMPRRGEFQHETGFSRSNLHQIFGPFVTLPAGQYRAVFGLRLAGLRLAAWRVRIRLDVAADGKTLAQTDFPAHHLGRATGEGIALPFSLPQESAGIEFRVWSGRRPLAGRLGFSGVRLHRVDAGAAVRLQPALLHNGEHMSLLVRLIAERTEPLYAAPRPAPTGPERSVAIAPLSNSDMRDWPARHYAALIRLLAEQLGCRILLIGSPAQACALDRIAALSGAAPLVTNLAGTTAFADVPDILRKTQIVICNNSGIAHLAAALGVRTLAIYSGSHQPQEWGPRGAQARALMSAVPCSPCGYDRLADCTQSHVCMQGLPPETVFAQARDWLENDPEPVRS